MDAREPGFRAAVQDRYNGIASIWESGDRWHEVVHREIGAAVRRLCAFRETPYDLVVDVGSGGEPQPIPARTYLQLDLALARLDGHPVAACADAHSMPLRDGAADCIVCVGSVVNYCSLIELAQELGRVCRPGGSLLFHVELSNSLEYLFRPHFRAEAALATTHYQGQTEDTWVYSLANVRRSLAGAGFRVTESRPFHILSSLAFRLGLAPNPAASLAVADSLLARVPVLAGMADSIILTCERGAGR